MNKRRPTGTWITTRPQFDSVGYRIVLARGEITSEIIDVLSKDEHWHVREEVARRSDLTPEQIQVLLKDKDWHVREQVKRTYKIAD